MQPVCVKLVAVVGFMMGVAAEAQYSITRKAGTCGVPQPGLLGTATLPFVTALIVYCSLTLNIFKLIYVEQPIPYMDEVFHIPQAQKYCDGNYRDWDPKITTLPGTYFMAASTIVIWNQTYGRLVPDWMDKDEDLCTTFQLRVVNVGVSIVNFCSIFVILGYYFPDMCKYKRAISTWNIATFPVLYFFSFLFYTDTMSTAFLLMMHSLYLMGLYASSALAGFTAVCCRQTNIVWVFYHGINTVLDILYDQYGDNIYMLPLEGKKLLLSKFRRSRSPEKSSKGKRNTSKPRGKKSTKPVIRPSIPSIAKVWRDCSDDFIERGHWYIWVGIGFLAFVVYNGGIVVGDKDAHQATINIPQVFYFALVFGTFTLPFMASRVRQVGLQLIQNPLNFICLFALFAGIIYVNSPAHPYLLADNRHYTFYVWKRFYESIPCLRYVWIPFYIMVWTLISQAMGVPKVFLCNFILCTCVNLIPQLLMEFRYFIPAYLYARLTFKDVTWCELALEFCIHLLFNILTIYIFLEKPFFWAGTTDIQRFMW